MLAPASQIAMLARGMLPAEQSLDKVVSPATLALVAQRVGRRSGMPLEPLKRFKPWMLAHDARRARVAEGGLRSRRSASTSTSTTARKPTARWSRGLRRWSFQISLFDGMTAEQQDHMLAESLKDLDTEQANVAKLANAWKAGDVPRSSASCSTT